MQDRTIVRRLLVTTAWLTATPLWLWIVLALAYWPDASILRRTFTVLAWLVISTAAWMRTPRAWAPWALAVLSALATMFWSFQSPSSSRNWAPLQDRMPTVSLEGDSVAIENFRNATYASDGTPTITWETRTYDLSRLRTVDLVVVPFGRWRGLAHVFVTFGFSDGEHAAISIESRRSVGVGYSPFLGLFHHYQLIYIVGDERDLIGSRANISRDPVYLYPVKTDPDRARALFVAMVHRAGELAVRPVFYNTATDSCSMALHRHVNALRAPQDRIALDWRILAPGYADELARDAGLIETDETLAEARARFLINSRASFRTDDDAVGRQWSAQIRDPGTAGR